MTYRPPPQNAELHSKQDDKADEAKQDDKADEAKQDDKAIITVTYHESTFFKRTHKGRLVFRAPEVGHDGGEKLLLRELGNVVVMMTSKDWSYTINLSKMKTLPTIGEIGDARINANKLYTAAQTNKRNLKRTQDMLETQTQINNDKNANDEEIAKAKEKFEENMKAAKEAKAAKKAKLLEDQTVEL